MHQAYILDEVRARIRLRRDGIAVFNSLSLLQTAPIVVDLQNRFMDRAQIMEVPMARTIVPNVRRIAPPLRCAG